MPERILHLKVGKKDSLIQAMRQMDRQRTKLLMVFDGDHFAGIITLGDIQRAILDNTSLSNEIITILDPNKEYAYSSDSPDAIKEKMLSMRCEYMPVVKENGDLDKVVFWEELFPSRSHIDKPVLNLPVIIMAGGKGTRLKPLTNVLPKPLIPIGDKTILENIMDSFVEVGCNDFYLSVNYKAGLIKHYFDTLGDGKYRIKYYHEKKPLGTAGSLHLLKNDINSTFFVSNCDILIEQDYSELLDYHFGNKNELTMVAALKTYPIPYGIITTGENGILHTIEEKPEMTVKINTGFYILEPQLLYEIPENEYYNITSLIDNLIKQNRRIGVFPISDSSWKDIGDWNEYLKYGMK